MSTFSSRSFRALLALSMVVASPVPLIADDQSREPLHVQVGRGVFRLEHGETISRNGQPNPDTLLKPDGTAFAVRHNGRAFLITARHVAERVYDLRARVPARRNDTGATEVIELRIPKEAWVFHEQGREERREGNAIVRLRGIDVAVAPLPGIKDRGIVVFGSCSPCPAGESRVLGGSKSLRMSQVFDMSQQKAPFPPNGKRAVGQRESAASRCARQDPCGRQLAVKPVSRSGGRPRIWAVNDRSSQRGREAATEI
jgi:hypothetical protein